MKTAATVIALLAAFALATFALVRGTWAVGGSDSSCYALTAEALAHGLIQPRLVLATSAPWPDASRTFAPAGFIPSPVRPALASPVCAPGFSLLMVPFRWIGGRDGIFLVTPIAAALLVWCAFVVARQLAGPSAGVLAAVSVATSPIVLFQAPQPMNDITTATLWIAVIAAAASQRRNRGWIVGVLTGLAILVRPNLAPAAIVVGLWAMLDSRATFVRFVAAAAPFAAVVATLNWRLYGHPLRVGYGNAADLFNLSNVPINLSHYGRALIETQTPIPLLAIAAPVLAPRGRRAAVWLAVGVTAVTTAIYLAYRPFDEWWYLRFLLPALALAIALASAVLAGLLRKPVLVAAAAVVIATLDIRAAASRDVFDIQRLEARFRDTGEFVRTRVPANAIFFAVWQSGTVRFYAQREAIVWDSLDPTQFDRAVVWARQQGLEPFVLAERWEEPQFRQRFTGASQFGALDWPPRVEIDRQVRIYALADREAYLGGRPTPTEYVWPVPPRLGIFHKAREGEPR